MKYSILLTIFVAITFLAKAQIPPGYYDAANGLTGDALKISLHNIIDDHTEYSYDDLRDFILMETDEDPNNPSNIILLYTGRSQDKNTFGGGANDWNREHVWAKSHGDFGNNPPCGTDAHHIRPTDASVNSARGNKDFDNGGIQHPEATGCYYTEFTWEPRDEVKGDVARMIFYMDVRYEGGSGELNLEVVDWVNTSPDPEHGKFSTLYEWHQQDPPDDFEINRNNVIYSYQNNRNPFIDHPEYL
ncbi:MAG: endonuclease, partial [Bacteroidales bacterium]|nr:endonuclease [Bacteroidales bacterium]